MMFHRSTMAEIPIARIGISTGLQAGGFIGLYLGFALAVLSALTNPDDIPRILKFLCFTPIVLALLLGPFLGLRRAPQMQSENPLGEVQAALAQYNEGQGKWRVLSHLRWDGRIVSIDLHNSTQPLAIVASTLDFSEHFPVRYIVGKGEQKSRDPLLRGQVLGYIEQHVDINRRKRTSTSVEVMPSSIIAHMDATQLLHRRLFYLLPIILFFAYLEMR